MGIDDNPTYINKMNKLIGRSKERIDTHKRSRKARQCMGFALPWLHFVQLQRVPHIV